MREVISINGNETLDTLHTAPVFLRSQYQDHFNVLTSLRFLVGQAGCQIANSCWEVSFHTTQIGCPLFATQQLA